MNILDILILGIVQGLTEWLPISSSGHLVLFHSFLGIQPNIAFDLALHLGTLLAVFFFFWKDLWKMLLALLRWKTKHYHFKLTGYVFVASLITGIFGLLFYDSVQPFFGNVAAVAVFLMVNGIFLIFVNRFLGRHPVGLLSSFAVGLGQVVSLLPGISRSGTTTGIGILVGIKREEAFRFSFLLSIPAIIGANLYSLQKEAFVFSSLTFVGILVACVTGLLALQWLQRWLRQSKLHYFGWYCIGIGILVTLSLIF